MPEEFRIKGQKELERAFLELRRETLKGMRPALRAIGEVVRADAQQRAGAQIANIGPAWQGMRLGVTIKGVYIAPRRRNAGGPKRPNLAGLLMDQAMQPAADAHETEVVMALDELVNVTASRNGF